MKFLIDVPPRNPDSHPTWHNVTERDTYVEALKFVQEQYGADAEGRVSLITVIDEEVE